MEIHIVIWLFKYVCLFLYLQRLQAKVLKLVDVSYGGENGFNQVSAFPRQSCSFPSSFSFPQQGNCCC